MENQETPCPAGLWIAGQFQKWAIGIAEAVQRRGIFRLPRSLRSDDRKWLVLTIDDAPSSRTEEILEILRRYSVRTTFFVHTDQINTPRRERAMDRIAEQGHEIAHHMPANVAYDRRFSAARFRADFLKSHVRLETYGESFHPWFRPPMGIYHHKRMGKVLEEFGYHQPLKMLTSGRNHFMASFAPWDSTGSTNTTNTAHNHRVAKRYASQLIASLYPGCIVVFHDGEDGGNEARLDATLVSLESFLAQAIARGWTVYSVGQTA